MDINGTSRAPTAAPEVNSLNGHKTRWRCKKREHRLVTIRQDYPNWNKEEKYELKKSETAVETAWQSNIRSGSLRTKRKEGTTHRLSWNFNKIMNLRVGKAQRTVVLRRGFWEESSEHFSVKFCRLCQVSPHFWVLCKIADSSVALRPIECFGE